MISNPSELSTISVSVSGIQSTVDETLSNVNDVQTTTDELSVAVSGVQATTDTLYLSVSGVQVTSDEMLLTEIRHDDHFHNAERWLGAVPGWDGSNEITAASNDSLTDFVIDAGNNTWGAGYCIIGSGDTPVVSGAILFDMHNILVTQAERDEKYRLRFAWGLSYASAVASGHFSETEFKPISGSNDTGPAEVRMIKLAPGTKVFAACWCQGQNTGTINFTVGLHEYPVVED